MRILTVLGTRPELIRLSLVFQRLREAGIENTLVHTGQNYDPLLSDVFFDELGLPEPDIWLGIRGANAGQQIGRIIEETYSLMERDPPDGVLILGDTNSGLSALPAARLGIPIFHLEAGNRCFDFDVPEEVNRRLIDHISTWLLPYTPQSRDYLIDEGIDRSDIFLCGNPITDVLRAFENRWSGSAVLSDLDVSPGEYLLATVHRQESVDDPHRLQVIVDGLNMAADTIDLPVIWSVHPRTRPRLEHLERNPGERIQLHEPFGFFDFVKLETEARGVITDSGTVQEECSLFKVPTVTCRDTTERPETLACGSNVLSGVDDPRRIASCLELMVNGPLDWTSPYEGPLHHHVADKVVKFIVTSLR